MGFPILVRWHLYIESGPRGSATCAFLCYGWFCISQWWYHMLTLLVLAVEYWRITTSIQWLLMPWWHEELPCYWGFLQIMVNLSPDPTRPDGSELPIFSYGGEGIPRVPKQYRFSPHRYIFPKWWSNQLNQSERRKYAQLPWITTDPGNGLLSARRQAIAWTNFHFIINYTATNTLQWFF